MAPRPSGKIAVGENMIRAACRAPAAFGNHTVPSLQSRQLLDLATYYYMRGANKDSSRRVNRNRLRGHPPSLSFHRRSKILIGLSAGGLVFRQELCIRDGVEGCTPPLAGSNTCIAGSGPIGQP
jgi:hypothetical protein